MSRSSRHRAQVEPIAAIAAVFALGVGLTMYAGTLGDVLPRTGEQNTARPALDAVENVTERDGVVDPSQLSRATAAAPAGDRLNATLAAADRTWHVGPAVPATADHATARVSVRLDAGRIRPGRLTVRVW